MFTRDHGRAFRPNWQMADAAAIAILPMIATVLGVVIIGTAIAGLASPRLRSR